MNARFLRDEAARFRGMADDADREATRVRCLAMADDYEARASAAHELTAPNPGEANSELVEPPLGDGIKVLAEPGMGETLTVKPVRKITLGLNETIMVERRSVVRRRLT